MKNSHGKVKEGPRKTYNTVKECSHGFLNALQYITLSLPNFNNIHSLQISCYRPDQATCMDELVELLFKIPSVRWLYVDSPLQELEEWLVSPALQDLESLSSPNLPHWPEPAPYPKLHRMVTRLSLKEWNEEKLTVRLLLEKLEPAVAACSDHTRSLTLCFRTFLKGVSGQDILQHFSSWASRKGQLLSLRSLEKDGALHFRLRLEPKEGSLLELEARIRLTGLSLNV